MPGENEYNFSLTTFSPSGKLVQIEYALNGVAKGSPTIGIKAKDGVVIAAEKKMSSTLIDDNSFNKIEHFTENIGVVAAGMPADFRIVVKKGRKEAIKHKLQYGENIPGAQLVKKVASVMQEYTHSGGVRPFGISLLVASYDENGPQLFQIDPSGAYFPWKAAAIGSRMQSNKSFLERRHSNDLELEDAIHIAILTLKDCFEGELTNKNIEIGIVGKSKKFEILTPDIIADYLSEIN